MREKLITYSLLSFASFCFFMVFFHTVAEAQTLTTGPFIAQAQEVNPTNIPTQVPLPPTTTPTAIPTQIPTPTPTALPTPTAIPTVQPTIVVVSDLEALFTKYSDEYHADKELLKRIARCESSFNSQAMNGPYAGMFQFAEQSWTTARNAMGMDTNQELRKNAEESIRTAAYMVAKGKENAWLNCK